MSVTVLMSVFEEEELLPRALASLVEVGFQPNEIMVVDGAWKGGKGGSHTFAESEGPSSDRTMEIANDAGCICVDKVSPWESQEEKRTFMFKLAREETTHFLVTDADETWHGEFPFDSLPDDHAHVMVKCIGENDMPGVRGIWPHGDYCPDYKPEFRFFKRFSDLECLGPGKYWADGNLVRQYKPHPPGAPNLPVLEGIAFHHHGNDRTPARKAQKLDYYAVEHVQRDKWLKSIDKALGGDR